MPLYQAVMASVVGPGWGTSFGLERFGLETGFSYFPVISAAFGSQSCDVILDFPRFNNLLTEHGYI